MPSSAARWASERMQPECEDDPIDAVLKHLFDIINMSMNDLLYIVDKKYRTLWTNIKNRNRIFPNWIEKFIFWPFTILYALYVRLPLLLLGHIGRYAVLFVQVACHRSKLTSRLVLQISALCKIARMIIEKVATTKISELFSSIVQTVLEFFRIWNAPLNSPKKARSITHLVELLEYQEDDEDMLPDHLPNRRALVHNRRLAMNPFRARVRISNSNTPVSCSRAGHTWNIQGYAGVHDEICSYPNTPSSFPCSPDSRARHMSVSDVEADSVVFYVRDKLRLQTQSASSDMVTAQAASRMLKAGYNIAFDPTFTYQDTYLACGNHYVLKTGPSGSCSSCRSSITVWSGVYVYVEFSITSQSEKNPSSFVSGPVDLSIGLIPADCPPNVSAGQWPQSIGLLSDGKLLVSGTECKYDLDKGEYQCSPSVQVTASTTIGMLIYIPKSCDDTNSAKFQHSTPSRKSPKREKDCCRHEVHHKTGHHDNDFDDIDTLGFEEDASVVEKWGRPDSSVSSPTDTDVDITASIPDTAKEQFSLTYNMNGVVLDMNVTSRTLIAESIHSERSSMPQLYPVVSLMSKNSGSWCRFSESDIVYKTRREIGAPPGERVYCLDGSVLLDSCCSM